MTALVVLFCLVFIEYLLLFKFFCDGDQFCDDYLGPVVQSIISLTSSLRGQLVKCFTTL